MYPFSRVRRRLQSTGASGDGRDTAASDAGECESDGLASGSAVYLKCYGVQFWVREENSYEHYHGI
jgi:hypothetical protein